MNFNRNMLSAAVATAIAAPALAGAAGLGLGLGNTAGAQVDIQATSAFDLGRGGEYRSGDFHNHTTCSDGSTSVETLTRQALRTYGHDWFIHVGHSGRGPRDCNVSDFLYHANSGGGGAVGLWSNTVGNAAIKGDVRTRTFTMQSIDPNDPAAVATVPVQQTVRDMWRWQSLQEFNLPGIIAEAEQPGNEDKVAFLGLEWTVPGHEHSSNTITEGQYGENRNADALAQFEYCFARPSDDTSQGGGQGWTCELSEEDNNKLIAQFAGRPEEGIADYNSTLSAEGINIDDNGEHVKAAAAVLWMEANFPGQSMAVQAHVERQGAFVTGNNRGWNVEHMRDMNDLAPNVAFGFESQPGHQAQRNRGSYAPSRPTAGLATYGGTGAYSAAEVSRPGLDFDGTPLTREDFLEGGKYEIVGDNAQLVRTVVSRPGVRTMWDAMLSEGRKFWFFGSSDWHSRGSFGPTHPATDNDFWPGEYQDNFTYVMDNNPADPAQDIVDALRSGNTFVVQGQLIDAMKFEACVGTNCATMGETLNVNAGDLVRVTLTVNDPRGTNFSPYTFSNPIHKQLGMDVPVNEPELEHVELIMGAVTGPVPVSNLDEYKNPLAPETTRIVKQFGKRRLGPTPTKRMTYVFRATEDSYIRARGSNVPPGTPNVSDMDGNPLIDTLRDNIACADPLCPTHVNGILDKDLEAWAEVWFYSNPIFIEVNGANGLNGQLQAIR